MGTDIGDISTNHNHAHHSHHDSSSSSRFQRAHIVLLIQPLQWVEHCPFSLMDAPNCHLYHDTQPTGIVAPHPTLCHFSQRCHSCHFSTDLEPVSLQQFSLHCKGNTANEESQAMCSIPVTPIHPTVPRLSFIQDSPSDTSSDSDNGL